MITTLMADWPRAHGQPLFSAQLRMLPADFQVTEQLGWEPSDDGEHDYLFVEKTGANTEWVARQLAQHAGVPLKDVGFAGLKDRHAITRQWFSVPRWHAPDWGALEVAGVAILECHRHLRKLRRGAHRANAFSILLRHTERLDTEAVAQRLQIIGSLGVPNYFGEQRFGRNGANLQLVEEWTQGRRMPRQKRSLAISTLRACLFNQSLGVRVQAGTWNQLLSGDTANLDGSGSVFSVEQLDQTLQQRCTDMDVHPAGILAGEDSGIGPEHWQTALQRARVEAGTRSLRLRVRDLNSESAEGGLLLNFSLPSGAFATAVLRELCDY